MEEVEMIRPSEIFQKFFDGLVAALRAQGVGTGDMIYITSDVTGLMNTARKRFGVRTAVERDAYLDAFVNALQSLVTMEGTLLFPAFTWSFCKGKPFDIRRTYSQVGALNNWILMHRDDFRRTKHPLYSFLVWGKRSADLLALENRDAFGNDSPFSYIHRHHGKLLLFDVNLQRGFTFMHYVEESIRVPYRYLKAFRGRYTDAGGNTDERIYTMYVRDLDIVSQEYLRDSFPEERGLLLRFSWQDLTLGVLDLAMAYSLYCDDFRMHGGRECYHFTNYAIDWTNPPTHEDDLVR